MAKRKLTRQQQSRIKQQQDSRRQLVAQQDSSELESGQAGIVIANHGKTVIVEDSQRHSFTCHLRQNIGTLVCGDHVVWQQEEAASGIVLALSPRNNFLARPDKRGQARVLAANIDQIIVVSATRPALNTRLIDRYLLAAETAGIEPVILFNKIDLLDKAGIQAIKDQLQVYSSLGYPLIFTCVKQSHGTDELLPVLKNKISVFVGQSGVGKSSLINALLPEANADVGDVSSSSNKGRHTTTLAQLYHLPNGGDLIDSPGIREFGLWQISIEQAARGFIEFRPLLGQCRFRDCLHEDEPGCCIRAAVDKGEINQQRWESYRRIIESLRTGI
jgi:ribosome biogenesis GTPase